MICVAAEIDEWRPLAKFVKRLCNYCPTGWPFDDLPFELLTVALCLLVFMPWNLPLWWQLRRCATRSKRGYCGVDTMRLSTARPYCDRSAAVRVHWRGDGDVGIKIVSGREDKTMVRKPGKDWRLVAALGCLSLALVAVAAEVGPPNATTPSEASVSITLDSAVLDRYTGDYELAPGAVLAVTRLGNQLFAQLTGQPSAEIFPQSEGEFFYKIVKAQIRLSVMRKDAQPGWCSISMAPTWRPLA